MARKPGPMQMLGIDACRIPTNDKLGGGRVSTTAQGWDRPWKHDENAIMACQIRGASNVAHAESLGRWPANLILDESAAIELDGQTGLLDGASRFFYISKPDVSERHSQGMNHHPTVKPVDLAAYLAKLISPETENPRLLVPYSGSGSEIMGALRAGWQSVTGIELEQEYIDIAERRIAGDAPLFTAQEPGMEVIG